MRIAIIAVACGVGAMLCQASAAETFGSGDDAFTIPFVTVGDPGNPADTTGTPNPAGRVDYVYQIGKYEVPERAVRNANALAEAAGEPLGITLDERGPDKPATGLSWFEAARFVNWLNADRGLPPAYHFDAAGVFQLWAPGNPGYDPRNPYRSTQARYFLPTADEWYKAAFYDPAAGVYWDYPNGSNDPPTPVAAGTDPGTAVYQQDGPADVQLAGGESPYGTVGQGGNVVEMEEASADLLNSTPDISRGVRGRDWSLGTPQLAQESLSKSSRRMRLPSRENLNVGFRIAAIPEPSSLVALLLASCAYALRKPRTRRARQAVRPRPLRVEEVEERRRLATLTVTLESDGANPVEDGEITLREAILYINHNGIDPLPGEFVLNNIDETQDPLGQNDRIVFSSSLFTTGPATIELTAGQLFINNSVEIVGQGYDQLTIQRS